MLRSWMAEYYLAKPIVSKIDCVFLEHLILVLLENFVI